MPLVQYIPVRPCIPIKEFQKFIVVWYHADMKTLQQTLTHRILLVTALCVAVLFTSCDTQGDSKPQNVSDSFIDQDLQGSINGKSFVLVSGYAENDYWEDDKYSFLLYNIDTEDSLDPWDLGAYSWLLDKLIVMFDTPKEEGYYPLSLDWIDLSSNQTVTLVDDVADEIPLNIIKSEGAIEITEIDLVNNTISGRICTSFEGGSGINGNFTVPLAPVE